MCREESPSGGRFDVGALGPRVREDDDKEAPSTDPTNIASDARNVDAMRLPRCVGVVGDAYPTTCLGKHPARWMIPEKPDLHAQHCVQ